MAVCVPRQACPSGNCRATAGAQNAASNSCRRQSVLALQSEHGRITSPPMTAEGAFLMSQTCLPHMPPGDAAIIHISSTRAHQVPLRLLLLLLGCCHVIGSLDGTLLMPGTQQGRVRRGPMQHHGANCAPPRLVPQSEAHTEAYAAAKSGMLGLTHAQAISLAHKVRCGWERSAGCAEVQSARPGGRSKHLSCRDCVPRGSGNLGTR